MSQETDNPEPEVTDDLPVNREGLERHGIKLSTPIGEIAIAISTPRGGLAIPKRFDPLGLANRALGVAKFGFKLAAWGGEQIAIALEFAGKTEKAKDWYEKIVTDQPKSAEAERARAVARRGT